MKLLIVINFIRPINTWFSRLPASSYDFCSYIDYLSLIHINRYLSFCLFTQIIKCNIPCLSVCHPYLSSVSVICIQKNRHVENCWEEWTPCLLCLCLNESSVLRVYTELRSEWLSRADTPFADDSQDGRQAFKSANRWKIRVGSTTLRTVWPDTKRI